MNQRTINFTCYNAEDEEVEYELPAKFEICSRCDGEGRHVNPNIDGNGITSEEWYGPDWDDESREMYMSGGYDVSCEECHGQRVVLVVDEDLIESHGTAEQKETLKLYHKKLQDDYNYRRECEYERRMGY